MTARRTPRFAVSTTQEELLNGLNSRLESADTEAMASLPDAPQFPIVFVVGPPRSGTTLTMQWLADSGQFAYPTNLLSRFFRAPYIGAQIQMLTTDPAYDFHGEISGANGRSSWQSETGKTSGALEPHEFSYFWRRFFPMDQARRLTDDEWSISDRTGFARGWAAMEAAFGKPMAAKGILGQYNIPQLAELLPSAVFIHTQRDPFFNVQSLLAARERVYGTRDAWFSVQPPGYEELLDRSPIEQVVAQVMTTNELIRDAATEVGADRWVSQPYQDFCSDPTTTYGGLQRAFSAQGYDLEDTFRREPFAITDHVKVDATDETAIREAIATWPPTSGGAA